jgi:hypothetical protein
VTGLGMTSLTFTSSSLANNVTQTIDINPAGKVYIINNVITSAACNLRIYGNSAKRIADAIRPTGVIPTGEHGLMFELSLDSSNLDWGLVPPATCCNNDSPIAGVSYITIRNMSGSTQAITVTLSVVVLA